MKLRTIAASALLLWLFAVIGTALVSFTFESTRERIAENERQALLRSLNALIPTSDYDNDVYQDAIEVTDRERLGTTRPITVYRARQAGKPVAVAILSQAPDGYSGTIRLLVAVRYDGTLGGVRVLAHRETPGLGDAIEVERTDWIRAFTNRSLDNPEEGKWKVRKDGGVFDQFTGATITPRAVVKAVYNTLVYFREHRDGLFK
ncbi:electron transport complex subunit RsxG [Endothiovibrio diazotrophicus]